MAVASYIENEVLLDDTIFLVIGLSWSISFQAFVLLVAVLVTRQSIVLVRCCYTIIAHR